MTLPVLYHCGDARSLRCLWAAEETGFALDLRMLPFPPRVFAKDYKDINPLGTVPGWLEDGAVLTESAAICERIAAGTVLEVRPDEPDHWPYRNWLHRSDATLTFPLTIVLRYTRLEPAERRPAQAVDDYAGFFAGRARSIEESLSDGREWLCAGRFTIADICVSYAAFLAQTLGLRDSLGEATQAWLDRCMARPAFVAARERQSAGT